MQGIYNTYTVHVALAILEMGDTPYLQAVKVTISPIDKPHVLFSANSVFSADRCPHI